MNDIHRARVFVSVGVFMALLAAMTNAEQASTPAVRRDVVQPSSLFTRLDIVVFVTIRDKCQSARIDGEALNPPRVQRLAMARVDAIMRVNQRSAASPDRSPGHLVLHLDSDLDLVPGKSYFLMLNFIRKGPLWPWASRSFPVYGIAAENPGFEVDDSNVVHALRRTPESMPYDGKGFGDLVKAIERGR